MEDPKREMAQDLILTLTAIETAVSANLSPAVSLAASRGEELAGGMPMERRDNDRFNEGEGQ